ncbi:MAG TPA: hypothetical protein VIV12_29300 [Streptosporangiaceae bacterium]
MGDHLATVFNLPALTQGAGDDERRARGKATDAVWQDAGGVTYEDPYGPNGWRAKGDQQTRERALLVLRMLGLAPYDKPPPETDLARWGSTRMRVYGKCPVCRCRETVRLDGMVGNHKYNGRRCPGGGREPVDA